MRVVVSVAVAVLIAAVLGASFSGYTHAQDSPHPFAVGTRCMFIEKDPPKLSAPFSLTARDGQPARVIEVRGEWVRVDTSESGTRQEFWINVSQIQMAICPAP